MFAFLPVLIVVQAPWPASLATDPTAWVPRPDWVGTEAAADYGLAADGADLRFSVGTPGKRMKWRHDGRIVPLEIAPWLVLTCKAEGIVGGAQDYLVWVDAPSGDGTNVITYGDVTVDGAWHTLAVNLEELVSGVDPGACALQVIAGATGGTLEILELRSATTPPDGASIVGPAEEAKEPLSLDLGSRAEWSSQPSWLANPGDGSVGTGERGLRFAARQAGTGVKWSHGLAQQVDIAGYRYATLKYRAERGGDSDYAVALLGTGADGSDYVVLARGSELAQDGGLHSLCIPVRDAARKLRQVSGIAFQVQATAADAWMEVVSLTLTTERTDQPVEELVLSMQTTPDADWTELEVTGAEVTQPGAPDWGQPIDAIASCSGLAGWLPAGRVAASGVPFTPCASGAEPCLTPGAPGELSLRVGRPGAELYLLVIAGMFGKDEPVRGEGPLRRLTGPDRFMVRLEYADGRVVECVPMIVPPTYSPAVAWGLSEGLQVLRLPLDPERKLASVALTTRTDQVGIALAAATLMTGEPRNPAPEEAYTPRADRGLADATAPDGPATVAREGPVIRVSTPELTAEIGIVGAPSLKSFRSSALGGLRLTDPGAPLFRFTVDGTEVGPGRVSTDSVEVADGAAQLAGRAGALSWTLRIFASREHGVGLDLSVKNEGTGAARVAVSGPALGVVLPGEGPPTYCFPRHAAVVSDADTSLSAEYGGWGLKNQFMAAGTADGAGCVALYTTDLSGKPRLYDLAKAGNDVRLGVRFPERSLDAGAARALSPTWLAAHEGDWHTAFGRYRAWVNSARPPISPRQRWFREVWSFRQRFLHWMDPLWTDESKPVDLQPAVDEAAREFGGLEYLHIFDWGNAPGVGRTYARTGDADPAESWPGGYPAMRESMDRIRAQGVPVGLYIEGYLLESKGPLGQRIADRVAIIGPDGKPRYWPDATEVFACPAVEEWQRIQADSYKRAAAAMNSDGMYIDEFGFCSDWRSCYSPNHGHPVPDNLIDGEAALTRGVREALDSVKPGVVIYTEESPPDCNTYLQDGSFTYTMSSALGSGVRAPLNLYRFAFPSFKTIEILVCDKPTASWATGVAWVFFNGEAIWLEGPGREWFAPETRDTIRRCHSILRAHSLAFSSDDATPLVPTLAEGVYANRFESDDEVVFTLYNARHTTFEGAVLPLPQGCAGPVLDLWNGGEAGVSGMPGAESVSARIGPLGVGCVVVRKADR